VICPSVSDLKHSPSLQVASVPVPGALLWGDTSTGVFCPLVPVQLRRAIFAALHDAAHPGAMATKRLVSARFVWSGLARNVTEWARQCLPCQWAKVRRHTHLLAVHIPVPAGRFQHLHVDLVGPLPPSGGFSYLFTIIDRSTRWLEAIPLASTTASNCSAALFHVWVTRFDVPAAVTSDRGRQFTSNLWAALCSLLRIQHISMTAYNPQTNGLVERQYRRLKEALTA